MKRCMGCMEEYDESLSVCPHCGYDENTKPAEGYHMLPGSVLSGKYIIGKTLGYGGFGVTYMGYDAELDRKVAVKEYLPGEFSTRVPGQTQVTVYAGEKGEQFQSGITRFMDEAKRLAKFQNTPGIVHIYDSFFENGTAYIVMEYIEGETLKEKLAQEGKLPFEEALELILPIVAAMKEVHAAGILHRDIAPDNIMVDKEGNAKLIDFGASRYATTTHSKSLSVLIKPGYAPMEQYQSRGQQGTWTDVYALAATLYTALTGCVPEDSMERMGKDGVKPLSKMGVKVSKNVETAIRNAMNIKVEERTPSMDVFEQELLSEKEVARLVVKKERNDVGKWPIWVKAAAGVGAAMVAGFVLLLVTGVISFSGGKFDGFVVAVGTTIVPNMVNVTIEEAETAAAGNKLEVQIVGKVYSDEIPRGYVLDQNVKAGSKVDEGSVLELTISAGVENVYMPSTEGLSKEAAIALLEQQELKYTIEEVESMTAPGYVVSQSIAFDEEIAKGTEVVIRVSKGLEGIDPTQEVTMPDLSGVDYAEAQRMLAELGLYIGKESEVFDRTVAKDGILYQSVPAGNTLHQGDTVMVQVSKGKEQVRVPDVWLLSEDEARAKCAEAGLMVECTYQSDTAKAGLVISSDPEEKTLVDVGSVVKLVVSTGKDTSTDTTQTGETKTEESKTAESKKQAEWSGWVSALPAGVTSDRYDIEERHLYSYSDKLVLSPTTDATLESQGYTVESREERPGEWGSFSEWSTTEIPVTDPQTQNVEIGWQYRGRESTTSYSRLDGWDMDGYAIDSWTDWSDWMELPVNDAAGTRQTETQQFDDTNSPIYKRYYKYSRYVITYKDPDPPYGTCKHGGAQRSSVQDYYDYITNWRKTHPDWPFSEHTDDTGWRENPLTRIDNSSTGEARWTGPDIDGDGWNDWYNEQTEDRIVGYNKKTMWRFKDPIYIYYLSKWSDNWSGVTTTRSGDTSLQERQLWRVQTRTMTTWYTYSKWSDYSGETETRRSFDPNTTREKERIEYRYREK